MDTLSGVRFILKPIVFSGGAAAGTADRRRDAFGVTGSLSANPIEDIQDRFGNWGLRFMVIALAVTPLRQLTGIVWIGRFRRLLGLFAFFYVALHFLVWLVLDQQLFWPGILEDIGLRPYVTIGFAAFVILLAMALTSTAGLRRRLGKRWQQLHNGAYVAGILGVWHYWWQVKADIREPLIYAVILTALLGFRVWKRRSKRAGRPGAAKNPHSAAA